MSKIKAAIAYFEDAIRESDEIIADCSPGLQAELIGRKKHFEVALEMLKRPACGECLYKGNCDIHEAGQFGDFSFCSSGVRKKG